MGKVPVENAVLRGDTDEIFVRVRGGRTAVVRPDETGVGQGEGEGGGGEGEHRSGGGKDLRRAKHALPPPPEPRGRALPPPPQVLHEGPERPERPEHEGQAPPTTNTTTQLSWNERRVRQRAGVVKLDAFFRPKRGGGGGRY